MSRAKAKSHDRAFVVEARATLEVRVAVSLVQYFQNFRPSRGESSWACSMRQRYWALNLAECGWDEEWGRPVAWINSLVSDAYEDITGLGGMRDIGVEDDTDFDMENERVRIRPGDDPPSLDRHDWTPADFQDLVRLVRWLDPATRDSLENDPDQLELITELM
jgi:hypothetical protein